MAKKIIILERLESARYRVAFWASVPLARQAFYVDANATSAYSGATQQEVDDLKAGRVKEKVIDATYATGTPLAQVQAQLEAEYNKFQTEIDTANPWNRYGTSWDGVTWSAGGVS